MHILFISPYVPSLIRTRPYNFIRDLARRHEVSVLATDRTEVLSEASALRSWCRTVDAKSQGIMTSLRYSTAAALRGEPLQSGFCRSPGLERQLARMVDREMFDIIHIEHLRGAYVRKSIPARLPTVFDSVDCISLLLERTLRHSHSLRQRLVAMLELRRTRAYEASLMGEFDQITVTSSEDAQALRALAPGSEATVVANGVDLDYFQPKHGSREARTIVVSGKMSYHANVTAALHFVHDVFPLVRRVFPDARLRIVGSNPPPVIRGLTRDPAISVTGHLPDVRPAIADGTVAVCPVTVKVGIQNKILEAMAMGLPVVCTKEGIEGIAAQHGRDVLVAADPAGLAEHVCRLLADEELRNRIGHAGRSYVEVHHTWDGAVRKLEKVYEDAIERRALLLRERAELGRSYNVKDARQSSATDNGHRTAIPW